MPGPIMPLLGPRPGMGQGGLRGGFQQMRPDLRPDFMMGPGPQNHPAMMGKLLLSSFARMVQLSCECFVTGFSFAVNLVFCFHEIRDVFGFAGMRDYDALVKAS